MSRQLKPYKVDDVSYGNESIEVFFDRNGKTFFAAFGMDRVDDTDLAKAKAKALKLLQKPRTYVWEPVIVVERVAKDSAERYGRGGAQQSADLEFSFYRIERARSPTNQGIWYEREHEIDFKGGAADLPSWYDKEEKKKHIEKKRGERERNERLDLHSIGRKQEAVLPYSDALWAKLLAIRESISVARRTLYELTRGENMVEKLIGAAPPPPMLPPARRPTRAEVLEARRAASSGT